MSRLEVRNEQGEEISLNDLPGRKSYEDHLPHHAVIRFSLKKNKYESWSYINAVPFFDSENNFLGVVNTFYDFSDIKNSEQVLRILNEVSYSMTSSLSYEGRLEALASVIVPKVADWAALDMLDENGDMVRVAVVPRASKAGRSEPKKIRTRDTSLALKTISEGKPIISHDITSKDLGLSLMYAEDRKIARKLKLKSVCISPLRARDKTLGTITFAYKSSERPYQEFDVPMLTYFVQRASILLDNSRLFQLYQQVIREHKEMYTQVVKSESTLQLALDTGQMGVWELLIGPDTFTSSKGVNALFGYKRKGTVGPHLSDFFDHIYPQDRDLVEKGMKDAINGAKSYSCEFRVARKDKRLHWVLLQGHVVSDIENKPSRMVGILMDVTERKLYEEVVAKSEKNFKSIFNTSLDAIVILDDDRLIRNANPAACELFTFAKKDLLQKDFLHLIPDAYHKTFYSRWQKLQMTGNDRDEVEVVCGDGSVKIVEYTSKYQFMPHRNLYIFRDVTEQKEEINRREHLLGIASHELRTPLASIKAYVDLIKRQNRGNENEKITEYLEKIDIKADAVAMLVNDLLDMARIREGRLEFFYEMFDFDEFISEIIRDISMTTKTHTIVKKGVANTDVVADRNRLAQVVINIIKNAIKYSEVGSEVIVRVLDKTKSVSVSVQDYGIGVPEKDQQYIFNLFYRGKMQGEKKVEGLGVGLYLSNKIIQMHGGRITLESIVGEGSTFTITIPKEPKKLPSKQK
jgi:PAS domain S-box-containing protein